MALIREYFAATDRLGISGILLDEIGTTTDGQWLDLEGFYPLGFTVEGVYTGSVQICVSDNPRKPADTEHGAPLGSPVGNNGGTRALDQSYRWGKARVTAISSGTVKVHVFGAMIGRRS